MRFQIHLVLALLVCAAVATQLQAANPTTRPALCTPIDLPGLPNFAQVSSSLYRGAQPTADGFAELKKLGVKTVVNLRSLHSDYDLMSGTGLQYVHIPSTPLDLNEHDLAQFLKIMADPANHPVFVHCRQGADRTGCAVAVYRMAEQNWTRERAVAEMPNFHFHTVWSGISGYLKKADIRKLKARVVTAVAKVERVR